MKPACRIGQHDWQPSPRGTHEVCSKCQARYPCAGSCCHVDCIIDTGRELPDHITLVKKTTEPTESEGAKPAEPKEDTSCQTKPSPDETTTTS